MGVARVSVIGDCRVVGNRHFVLRRKVPDPEIYLGVGRRKHECRFDRFISLAIFCVSLAESRTAGVTTPAGLPERVDR